LTAQTWAALVAAVKHAETCGSQSAAIDADGRVVNLGLACDCDRDARIARGIAAARTEDTMHVFYHWPTRTCNCGVSCADNAAFVEHRDAAALAAFRKEAT